MSRTGKAWGRGLLGAVLLLLRNFRYLFWFSGPPLSNRYLFIVPIKVPKFIDGPVLSGLIRLGVEKRRGGIGMAEYLLLDLHRHLRIMHSARRASSEAAPSEGWQPKPPPNWSEHLPCHVLGMIDAAAGIGEDVFPSARSPLR